MCNYSLWFFLLLFVYKPHECQGKLQVEVLYESLCPDSLNFITQQLHPVFDDLSPYVDLKLTPFGKSASLKNGQQFICQHGPAECKGNKIQSCVLASIANQKAQVAYVTCFMRVFRKGQKHQQEFGHACSELVGVSPGIVEQCYSSQVGTNLQLIAEQDTLKYTPKFVPTIIYNGIFDQQLQDASLTNFKGVVCQLLDSNQIPTCLQ